jgi:phosphoglycolate phosphatase-like HAD superfamily hydrolase
MTRLWLFDFDGTLIDSEQAIKACYEKVTQEFLPSRSSFISTMLIGPTLDESARMILMKENYHLLEKFKTRFQELYDEKIILETPQYPFVNSTLKKLRKQGDNLAIVTNKRSYPTKKLINYFGWDKLFDWVLCMDEFPNLKNKTELIKIKLNAINLYESKYFIGDTTNDGVAANKNNIPFIKVNYGYGNSQAWESISIFKSIDFFHELLIINK